MHSANGLDLQAFPLTWALHEIESHDKCWCSVFPVWDLEVFSVCGRERNSSLPFKLR